MFVLFMLAFRFALLLELMQANKWPTVYPVARFRRTSNSLMAPRAFLGMRLRCSI